MLKKSCRPNRSCIIFKESKGYKHNVHYEAYQAIDLSKEIKKQNGEQENGMINQKILMKFILQEIKIFYVEDQ